MRKLLVVVFLFCHFQNPAQNQPASTTDSGFQNHLHINEEQSPRPACGHDWSKANFMGRYSSQQELQMNEAIRNNHASQNRDNEHTISIVVHIIHDNGPENISDAQVMQAIQDLNDAFGNTGPYQQQDGVDSQIRFCLAQQDPDGLPSTGITRHQNVLTNMFMEYDDEELKNIIRWDPTKYLNIWIVSSIGSQAMGSGVAGYAFLPYSHGLPEDGIVNEAQWFGSNTNNSKVHIHEVGHYLGLYHTFEGGCTNDDCQNNGDLVCDTPPDQNTSSLLCGETMNSCESDEDDSSTNNPFRSVAQGGIGDQPDLMENYMDYSNQTCQWIFTQGQADRMLDALLTVRSSLLESTGCFTSCGIGPVQIVAVETSLLTDVSYSFSQLSSAIVPVTYQWRIDGEVVGTGTTLEYTFDSAQTGEFMLYMDVLNESDNCLRSDSIALIVECNPPASFETPLGYTAVGDVIEFDGFDVMANSYHWYLDGELVSTSPTYNVSFDESSEHRIFLVSGNGFCTDTSEVDYFVVGDCFSGRNNHWMLGSGSGVHLDFTSGELEVSSAGFLLDNGLMSLEGVATISDQNGELLLYSDGRTIFNKFREPFFPGMGAGGSSAQGVQIVPDPGNVNQYYVFTCEHFGGLLEPTFTGFRYVKVDVTLNDGHCAVVSNYTQLLPAVCERQTAIRHCNGHDFWVITQGYPNLNFYSYLITDDGVSAPVVSTVGNFSGGQQGAALGMIKARPQGDIVAVSYPYASVIDMFSFDANTGQLSNEVFGSDFYSGQSAYGLEFSADGSKLYYAHEMSPQIRQVDLSSGNMNIIAASDMVVGVSGRPWYLGTFQLAPDGKIYIAQSGSYKMDVIHEPDQPGANCDFETNAIDLPEGILYGLNNCISSQQFAVLPQISGPSQVCPNTSDVLYYAGCGNLEWTYIGSNVMNEISDSEVSIDFIVPGIDTLICKKLDACFEHLSDTLIIHVGDYNFSLGNDTTICSSGYITLYAPAQFTNYHWSTGVYGNSIVVNNPGSYWVEGTVFGGCLVRDTIVITEFNQSFNVQSEDLVVCNHMDTWYEIVPEQGDFIHHWHSPDGTTMEVFNFYYQPQYGPVDILIYYENEAGCTAKDTITISSRPDLPPFELPDEIELCSGEIEYIDIDQELYPGCTFTWQDGSQSDPYTIYSSAPNQLTTYYVLRTDSLCSEYEYQWITVSTPTADNLMLSDSLQKCDGQTIELNAGWYYQDFVWQDGSTGHFYNATEPGLYWVSVETSCGVFYDSCYVSNFNIDYYSIHLPDTINTCQASLPLNLLPSFTPLYNYTWSNNSGGYAYQEGLITVSAQYMCGAVFDTTYVNVSTSPQNSLPDQINICDGAVSYVLTMPESQVTAWNGGTVSDSYEVITSGLVHFTTSIGNECDLSDSVFVNFSELFMNLPDTTICLGTSIEYVPETNGEWQWIGLLMPVENMISDTGNYYVYVTDNACVLVDYFHVGLENSENTSVTLYDSLSVCPDDFPFTVEVTGDQASSYSWSNGGNSSQTELENFGWYFVDAQFECVTRTDSIFIQSLPLPETTLPTDTALCAGSEIVLYGLQGATNTWSTGEVSESITVTEPDIITLEIVVEGMCAVEVSTHIQESDLFVDLSEVEMMCEGDTILLSASTNAEEVLWNTGSSGLSIMVTDGGAYSINVSKDGCSIGAEVNVIEMPAPQFTLGFDTLLTTVPFILEGPDAMSSYVWNIIGENGNELVVSTAGFYTLTVTDQNGCQFTDDIIISIEEVSTASFIRVPDVFTIDGGGLIAQYRNVDVYDVKVFDDIGRLVAYGNNFPLLWNGTVNGTPAATAMYFYIINYTDMEKRKQVKKGNSLLIR